MTTEEMQAALTPVCLAIKQDMAREMERRGHAAAVVTLSSGDGGPLTVSPALTLHPSWPTRLLLLTTQVHLGEWMTGMVYAGDHAAYRLTQKINKRLQRCLDDLRYLERTVARSTTTGPE
jgi:hypothetical protein